MNSPTRAVRADSRGPNSSAESTTGSEAKVIRRFPALMATVLFSNTYSAASMATRHRARVFHLDIKIPPSDTAVCRTEESPLMRQRDAEHTLRSPFRPESNSPSSRHCGQPSAPVDTCVPTLPVDFYYTGFSENSKSGSSRKNIQKESKKVLQAQHSIISFCGIMPSEHTGGDHYAAKDH